MSEGILYVATGEEHNREAVLSAKSVKRHMEDIPVTLLTDRRVESRYIDDTILIDDPEYSFDDKVQNVHRTPYDRTVLLDTDTYVCDEIYELFDVLEEFDMAASHLPHWDPRDFSADDIPLCYPEYSTGVIAYRNSERTADFFETWRREFEEDVRQGMHEDQFSFRRATYESDVRIATLPDEYNCIFWRMGRLRRKAKIFHGRLLDVDGPGMQEATDIREAVRKINGYDDKRVFINPGYLKVVPWSSHSLLKRAYASLRHRGVKFTLKRIASKSKEAVANH